MKTLKIILLLSLIILPETANSSDTNSTKYFPLKVGNIWSYEYYSPTPPPLGTRYRFRSTVTKDTLIGSHKYFFVTNTHIYILYNPAVNWFRVDSTNGNLLGYQAGISCRPGSLMLIDSLASDSNNLSQICITPIGRRRCYACGTNSLFSQQVPYKIFNYEIIAASDFKTYSRNFGISYCYMGETGAYTITLLGCVLNGILYGDTTLIGLHPLSEKIPNSFSLSQNYPNPFNPSTKIKFDIPLSRGVSEGRGVSVKLVVYDVLGREIANLIPPLWGGKEGLLPGTYEVEWDGSNYPSGVYFCKLITSDYSKTRKMVLVK
jgi:hypothetical protein